MLGERPDCVWVVEPIVVRLNEKGPSSKLSMVTAEVTEGAKRQAAIRNHSRIERAEVRAIRLRFPVRARFILNRFGGICKHF